MSIEIVKADITTQSVDAIVNAANSKLANGGGVAQAIRLAAGPEYQNECDTLAAKNPVSTGTAVITGAGNLPCDYVINAVGPIYGQHDGHEPELLASAYKSSMRVAAENELSSIAFCAISCGIYGYPLDEGAKTAVETVVSELKNHSGLQLVRFCLFGDKELQAFQRAHSNL